MTFSARTDVGRVRSQNEDNFLIDRKLQLYVVCDGMGGHLGGEIASATAVNVVRQTLLERREVIDGFAHDDGRFDKRDVLALVEDAVHVANQRIFERGNNNPAQRGMGTTLSLLLLTPGTGFVAHVGDSRVYRRRGDTLTQLTEDHSLVNEMARTMRVSTDHFDPRLRSALTRAVGVLAVVEVDAFAFTLSPGDRFLLASDGLHGLLDDPELNLLLDGDDLVEIANRLVDSANTAGGNDNITAVLVEVSGSVADRSESERLDYVDVLRSARLFEGMSEAETISLIDYLITRRLAPEELLLAQGRNSDTLGVVITGSLVASRNGQPMTSLEPGACFGEDAAFDETIAPCSLRASDAGPATVLLLTGASFRAMVEDHPAIALKLSLSLGESLARQIQKLRARATDLRDLHAPPAQVERRPRTTKRLAADTLVASTPPRAHAQPRPRAGAGPARVYPATTQPASTPRGAPQKPPPLPPGPPDPGSEGES